MMDIGSVSIAQNNKKEEKVRYGGWTEEVEGRSERLRDESVD